MLAEKKFHQTKYFVFTAEILIPVVIILLVITGIIVSFKSSLFAIVNIECQVDYHPCDNPYVIAELDKYKGQNLLTLQTEPIVSRLITGDFTIRQAEVRKIWPNTILFDLQSVYPVAAVQVRGNTGQWIVLDANNRVITMRESDPNVPTVIVDSPPTARIGSVVDDPRITKSIGFALKFRDELPRVISITLEGNTLTLNLADSRRALLDTNQDYPAQIRTLQAILADSTMIKDIRTIDVRFERPVLKSD